MPRSPQPAVPARAVEPRITDLVEVHAVETVVRLDGRPGRMAELVLTADVTAALTATLEAARPDSSHHGGAFFLVGHFGSGKSHLLAALAELLANPSAAPTEAPGWGPLAQRVAALGPTLAVTVPLVEHRAGAVLEDLVLAKAYAALGQEPGHREPAGTDRRAAWDALLQAATAAGRPTLLVAMDELSEFLRAKQSPALVEDLRFLQFLGEWAVGRPVVVVAALQESIEEVANVSQRELTRIRDRYRTLALSMRHVEDLVRGRLLRLRPGAEVTIEAAHRALQAAFPAWDVPLERFARCYPVHPATLALLEGLRFLFSQQRGVVDFVVRQMIGDPSAGIAPWQERGYLDLITPDRVFDHFRARLQERTETRQLAESVVPYWERAADEVFSNPADASLGLRATKLLCLLSASPLERPRSARELAGLLLARVSALDPAANVGYFEDAVLQPLAARGAYVVARPGPPQTYTVELAANTAEAAAVRMHQARAELSPTDRRVLRTLMELGSSSTLPLKLLGEIGTNRRELLWQNTLRRLLVTFARIPELTAADAADLVAQAKAIGAEGVVVVGEPEGAAGDLAEQARSVAAGSDRLVLWAPQPLRPEDVDTAMELHARRLVLQQATAEGHTEPGGLVELLTRASSGDAARAQELLRRAYFGGALVTPPGAPALDLPSLSGLPFERLLASMAGPLLTALHPLHGHIAPRGELVGERLVRQLVADVIPQRRITVATAERGQLRPLITGYLEPLGLMRKRQDAWVLGPDPTRSPAVAEVLRLVADPDGIDGSTLLQALADGPVGLTEAESLLALNACAQAGLLEVTRGRRPLTEPFLALTAAERLAAGELVEPAVRAALADLVAVMNLGDLEPWSSATQRAAWDRARTWLAARQEEVAEVRHGLAALAANPGLGDITTASIQDDLAIMTAALEACGPDLAAVTGLARLAGLAEDAPGLQAAARRLGNVARFLRQALAQVEPSLAFLGHPDLILPAHEETLVALREQALRLVPAMLVLAAEDRAGELIAALQAFRHAYATTYRQAHDAFYAGSGLAEVGLFRASPPYRALKALAGIRAIAVPDDLVRVERALHEAVPAPCNRRVDIELAWRPRCSCGFTLGQQAAPGGLEHVALIAQRGVAQYLGELAGEDVRRRLEAAAADLASLGRDELAADMAKFLALTGVAAPGPAEQAGLTHLLERGLAPAVQEVLGGGQLVVRRDLGALRDDLVGRRYPKRRLLELLASWVDPGGDLSPGTYVEILDPAAAASEPGAGQAAAPGVLAFLAEHFPRLGALLPAERPSEAFWLAAWWTSAVLHHGDPAPAPAWLPAALLEQGPALAAAAGAAVGDPGALADLAALDGRIGPQSLLGDQIAEALHLADRTASEVAEILAAERLFRLPVQLAAAELCRRLRSDWQLGQRLELDLDALTQAHPWLSPGDLAALDAILAAAGHLAELERRLAGASCRELAEDIYPTHHAPVAGLLSRAELAAVGGGLVPAEAIEAVAGGALRLQGQAQAAWADHAAAGYPGTCCIWDVGRSVLLPLIRSHGRVAVLLVDAMRADLWHLLRQEVADALSGRLWQQRWAVVPQPTRTAEAVSAMYLGRPVPAGAGPASPGSFGDPFAHLGYESAALVGVERAHSAEALREFWRSGPTISVAVATGVDEMLHRSSVELVGLLEEAAAGLRRRVLPTLAALPPTVPLVVLADHGFRENPNWGRGGRARWAHGGATLEECIVPVAVFDRVR